MKIDEPFIKINDPFIKIVRLSTIYVPFLAN